MDIILKVATLAMVKKHTLNSFTHKMDAFSSHTPYMSLSPETNNLAARSAARLPVFLVSTLKAVLSLPQPAHYLD